MSDKNTLHTLISSISTLMTEHRDYLISLDQVNGDGDLGISMDDGFQALAAYFASTDEEDLGQLLRNGGRTFNNAAPSSLGTILTFGLMGMAKTLRGFHEADFLRMTQAVDAGLQNIMDKAESKPGEKTIVDALVPGVKVLREGAASASGNTSAERKLLTAAAQASITGSEATREMTAVHGRAAYSAARSVGVLDGGSVVGRLIFEGASRAVTDR